MVKLKDIANECGLAVSTVSNILNNHQSSFASEAIRQKVFATAERLGYKKDYLSVSLRTRKTFSIGLILDQVDDLTRKAFLAPFIERLNARNYEVAVREHHHDAGLAHAALDGFVERCKDGVVLFTDTIDMDTAGCASLVRRIGDSGLPVLAIGSRLAGQVPCIDIDRAWAANATLRHFLDRGKRRLLVVFRERFELRGNFAYWDHPAVTFWEGVNSFADFQGHWEQGPADFDAVFFRTDAIAIPALRYFHLAGRRVPDQLEVVSFDNFPFSEFTIPALSTWDICFQKLGLRAQELLIDWLGGRVPSGDLFENYHPQFIPRASHTGGDQLTMEES